MTDYEKLKVEIKSWYPNENFTDAELSAMTDNVIKFFAIGAKAAYKQKRTAEIMKLHETRQLEIPDTPKGT